MQYYLMYHVLRFKIENPMYKYFIFKFHDIKVLKSFRKVLNDWK